SAATPPARATSAITPSPWSSASTESRSAGEGAIRKHAPVGTVEGSHFPALGPVRSRFGIGRRGRGFRGGRGDPCALGAHGFWRDRNERSTVNRWLMKV